MTTWLPSIEVRDTGEGFEVLGPREALTQLAEAFAGDVISAEVTPDDGSVIVVRVLDDGPVVMRHQCSHVEIAGGRASPRSFRGLAAPPRDGFSHSPVARSTPSPSGALCRPPVVGRRQRTRRLRLDFALIESARATYVRRDERLARAAATAAGDCPARMRYCALPAAAHCRRSRGRSRLVSWHCSSAAQAGPRPKAFVPVTAGAPLNLGDRGCRFAGRGSRRASRGA